MNYSPSLLKTTQGLIKKDFDLAALHIPYQETNSYEQLRNWLIQCVNQLLNYQLEQLFQALYRIDVSERKIRRLLHPKTQLATSLAEQITDLILEREIQKAQSRQQYRQYKQSQFMVEDDMEGVDRW